MGRIHVKGVLQIIGAGEIIADSKPIAGIEIVECSPPYDAAEITSLISTRVICDDLACQVRSGHLPSRKKP